MPLHFCASAEHLLSPWQHRTYFEGKQESALKKMFYALRPAAALQSLRPYPQEAIAPMDTPALLNECEPPAEISAIVATPISRKAVTREFGTGPLPGRIVEFIGGEFEAARAELPSGRFAIASQFRAAETFFRSTVLRLDRTS